MMKKMICVLAVMILAATVCFSAVAEPVMGGWSVSSDTAVTPESQSALDKALEGFVGSKVEAVALLATQVVAGTNYCFLCRVTPVTPDPVPHYSLVYVYQALDGTASILEFQDLAIGVSAAE